jgi:NAD-dependent deacetylase
VIAPDLHSGVEALGNMIAEASSIVPFTGAGISTECGIPDFRSPGGLWTRNRPIAFDEFISSPDARDESWRRRFAMEPTFAAARPGRGHRALAALYKAGKIPAIITQNIDNLHQMSGFKADDVVELHGNTTYARCIGCGQAYDLAWVKARFEANGAPDCTGCDEPVKTATISFGQAMPEDPDAPRHRTGAALRPVPGDRIVAGGVAGRGLSADGQELRCKTRDHQQRADRTGRCRRPGDPPRHRGDARTVRRQLI